MKKEIELKFLDNGELDRNKKLQREKKKKRKKKKVVRTKRAVLSGTGRRDNNTINHWLRKGNFKTIKKTSKVGGRVQRKVVKNFRDLLQRGEA